MDFTDNTPLCYSNNVSVYFRNEQKLPPFGVDLMLSILTPHRHKETLRNVVYMYYLDCSDGVMGICVCPNSSNCTHSTCAVFCVSIILQ